MRASAETGRSTAEHTSFKTKIAKRIVAGALVFGAGVGAVGAVGAVEARVSNLDELTHGDAQQQILMDLVLGEITAGSAMVAGYFLNLYGRAFLEIRDDRRRDKELKAWSRTHVTFAAPDKE